MRARAANNVLQFTGCKVSQSLLIEYQLFHYGPFLGGCIGVYWIVEKVLVRWCWWRALWTGMSSLADRYLGEEAAFHAPQFVCCEVSQGFLVEHQLCWNLNFHFEHAPFKRL
jgi:hypothetical protein